MFSEQYLSNLFEYLILSNFITTFKDYGKYFGEGIKGPLNGGIIVKI